MTIIVQAKKAQVADKDKGKGASKAAQAAKGGPKKGKAKKKDETHKMPDGKIMPGKKHSKEVKKDKK